MKKIVSLMIACLLALGLAGAFAEPQGAAYLAEYYNVNFEDEVTLDAFNDALTALGAAPVEAESLTLADAVVGAIRLAEMDELAQSYLNDEAPDKAANILTETGITVPEAAVPYVAAALDLGWLEEDAVLTGPVTGEAAADLLYLAAETAGKGRRYIGRITDENILTELRSVLDAAIIFDEETLTNLGREIVLRGATTGYGLKYAGFDARFLADYTIKYGHSSIKHASQLIALLASEGFDGYIQIEPKVSVYEYLLDWGTPGAPTPTAQTLQVTEDRYLTYAVEYDLMIEFDTAEEKEAFHQVIETYAKKYDDSFDADGNLTAKLIAGAWWQPLYSSTTPVENEEFGTLVDNVIYDATGNYSIHPFSVPEQTAAIEAVVSEVAPELSVNPQTIYVNPAFYRYITGSDYQ